MVDNVIPKENHNILIATFVFSFARDQIEEKYEGKLMKEMVGPEYEIVSRIMKTLVGRKITVPGSFVG